jgi:hypothetical protein
MTVHPNAMTNKFYILYGKKHAKWIVVVIVLLSMNYKYINILKLCKNPYI